ncbi:MAG: sugar ABC transporter permease [Natronospirillum sp.]
MYPIGSTFMTAFTESSYRAGTSEFVGLRNFKDLINDWFFQKASINTAIFTIAASLAQVFLGLLMALLFARPFSGRQWVIPAVIYPMMLSTLVVASIWKAWFHFDFGWLNNLFEAIGLSRVLWLSDPSLAIWSIVLTDTWHWTPMAFLIILAGLQGIPEDIQEAATLEGVTDLQRLLHITLPLLRGPLFLALLLRTVDAFKVFDKVYVMTGGGPASSTETLSMLVYKEGFRFFNLGNASAIAVVMLLVAGVLSAAYAWQVIRRPT